MIRLQICTNGILSKLSLSSLHHLVVICAFTLHREGEVKDEEVEEDEEEEKEAEEEDLTGDELEVYELTLGFLVTLASGEGNMRDACSVGCRLG